MPTNNTGVQTRAMAQRTDSEPQETQNQNVNPSETNQRHVARMQLRNGLPRRYNHLQ